MEKRHNAAKSLRQKMTNNYKKEEILKTYRTRKCGFLIVFVRDLKIYQKTFSDI